MKVKYSVIPVAGKLKAAIAEFASSQPTLEEIKEIVTPHLAGNDLERVRVFWAGVYTDMFVAERGIELGMRENPRATDVYMENVKVHLPPSSRPAKAYIYGPAVLFALPVWF